MKLPETKYLIAAAVVILLVVLYIYWRRKKTEKVTEKKSKRSKRSKSRKPRRKQDQETEDQEDDQEEEQEEPGDEDQDTAQELYNLIHDRMASGMKSEEFLEVVGDNYDNLTYIEIKQLYNDAKNRGQDPSQAITINDYANVIGKRSDD